MRWEGESDFTGGSSRNLPVEIKKNSPCAYVLGFSLELVVWIQANHCRKRHVKAPHHTPFLRVRLHPWRVLRKHSFDEDRSRAVRNQLSGSEGQGPAAPRQALITIQCIELPALCKSKKTHELFR